MEVLNLRGRTLLRRALGTLLDDATRALRFLGERLGRPALATMPISAVMLSRVATVSVEQPLEDVAQLLVAGRHDHLAIVQSSGVPVGVVTRGDVAIGLERSGPHTPVGEAPCHDVITVTPSDSLVDVLDKLRDTPETVAVLVDRGTPVGLLTVAQLVDYVDHGTKKTPA